MEALLGQDWATLFQIKVPLAQLIVRGSLMYLALLVLLRFFMKRQSGKIGAADLLVMVLVADAAQNALAGGYNSITEGLVLVSTIIFWSYVIDWLEYRYPAVSRLLYPPPLLLIKDGKIVNRALRKQLLTERELLSKLREQGVTEISQVKKAYIEGDGHISVFQSGKKA